MIPAGAAAASDSVFMAVRQVKAGLAREVLAQPILRNRRRMNMRQSVAACSIPPPRRQKSSKRGAVWTVL